MKETGFKFFKQGVERDLNNAERYIPVESSIIDACKEVREMQAGRLSEPSLEDFFVEMNNLVEQEKFNESNSYKTIQKRH